MSRKLKGFSLAELLISLLIISIVLSAAIPTITKKSGASRENIWHWTDQNNSVYAGTGLNQSVIIGVDRVPSISSKDVIVDDAESSDNVAGDFSRLLIKSTGGMDSDADFKNFTNEGNKLAIVKRHGYEGQSDFMASHIAFFNSPSDNNLSHGFIYAGRLAMDPGNIALGMGTLMNQDNPSDSKKVVGENTAIGHLALFQNTSGKRNTALGRNTLSINKFGSYNTALGFGSLFELGITPIASDATEANMSENTGVGALALKFHRIGSGNTAVGSRALKGLAGGGFNTAVGVNACGNRTNGNYNICIGANVGNGTFKDIFDHNNDSYNLFIGSDIGDSDDKNWPIISGSLRKNGNVDKFLSINARRFELRPYNGEFPVFNFEMLYGEDGYAEENKGSFGIASFNLRKTPTNSSDTSDLTLEFKAPHPNNLARIMAYNSKAKTNNYAGRADYLRDISFDNSLTFDFPNSVNRWNNSTTIPTYVGGGVAIRAESVNESSGALEHRFPLILNDIVQIYNSDTDNTCGEGCDREGSFIKLFQTKNNIPLTIDSQYNIKMLFGGSSLEFNKKGNGSAPSNKFDLYLIGSDDDSNDLHLSSVDGLTYKTNKSIYIKTTNDNASSIELGKTKLYGNGNDLIVSNVKTFSNTGSYNETLSKIKSQFDELRNPPSDARLKNIKGDNTAGLKEINALEVKNYTYKKDKDKTPHVGVIAQQLQKIFPDAVTKDEDGYLRIRTEDIFYAMVNSIKDLFKQIQDLTAKVTGLDKRISELEKQNKALAEQNKAIEKRLAKLEKEKAAKK